MDIQVFKDILFQKAFAYGFTDCEIYFEKGNSFEVRIFNGEIAQYKNASPQGLSFRGTYKGKMGYGYTEKIDEDVIELLVKHAAENAVIIEDTEVEMLYKGDTAYPNVNGYNEEMNAVSVEKKIEMAKAMEAAAYAMDKRVKSVDYCVIGTGEGETHILNSLGMTLSHQNNLAYGYVYVRVEDGEQVKLAMDPWFGNDFNDFLPEKVAKKSVEKAISYLNGSSVPSKKYPVIFDNITACDLFATYVSIFFAEGVQKGFSLLKNKVGERIASELVTIRDDGVYKNNLGNVPFDSEGVATQSKAVIEKGVLKTYLYNLKSAAKDGVSSTGNGFKAGFRGSISTACTNFYVSPADHGKAPEELYKEMGTGLLITELAGLHAGTNTVSGDFSISADGFLIEDGKIIRPVEQITIAGNFYALMENIIGIGNDLRFDLPSGSGTIGMPSILVSELNVSGE